MAISKKLTVGFVSTFTPESNYSQFLSESIYKSKQNDLKLIAYAPLHENVSNLRVGLKKKIWNYFWYPLQIAFHSFRDNIDIIHFQYEFNMYGSMIFSSFFPLALLLQKLIRKKVVTTVHVVVSQNEIDEDFKSTFNASLLPSALIKTWFYINYFFIGYISDTIIVHSECFKETLEREYKIDKNKIIVLNHGIPSYNNKDKKLNLFKKLIHNYKNKKVILSFGYITKRKGLDYLIKAFEKINKKYNEVILIIAGNVLIHEKKYIETLKKKIVDIPNILIIDRFLTLDEIKALYSNSYISVFPYTYSISASGTTALSFAFSVPLIVTNLGSFKEDIEETDCGILVNKKNAHDLEKAIEKLLTNKKVYKKIKYKMNIVKKERSWSNIAIQTINLYKNNLDIN